MKSLLITISLFLFLFLPGGSIDNVESVTHYFDNIASMEITIDNMLTSIQKGEEKFESILTQLKETTKHSHDMPAFGVSIDDLTRDEMKTGLWLELKFDKTQTFNDMPFDSLLIKLEKDCYGFNLIRCHKGKYEGRCFYLSLTKSMNELYREINSIPLN